MLDWHSLRRPPPFPPSPLIPPPRPPFILVQSQRHQSHKSQNLSLVAVSSASYHHCELDSYLVPIPTSAILSVCTVLRGSSRHRQSQGSANASDGVVQPFDYATALAEAPGLELGLNAAAEGARGRGRGRGRGGRDSGSRGRGRGMPLI